MKHEWLIEQIEGLRDYAAQSGLPALAAHLDEARLLAMTEIASTERLLVPDDTAGGGETGGGPP